jgi:hypothetical protein
MAKESSQIRKQRKAPIHRLSGVKIHTATSKEPKGPDFYRWKESFVTYLVREKTGTNPDLLELIHWLGEDGRQEVALSIFSFLRPSLWKDFCKDRQIVKQQAKKGLTKARSDLRRARLTYSALLASLPEMAAHRRLGEDRRLHLSDLLETEAVFLATQARIQRAIEQRVSRVPQKGSTESEQRTNRKIVAKILTASANLTRAAKSYRELLTVRSTVIIGKSFDSFIPSQLDGILKSEETELAGLLNRAPAFNKKRFGTKANLAHLVLLQYLVEIFGMRWNRYLPQNVTRILKDSDIADLLEAGTAASGVSECSTSTDAGSIGRALERFRNRESNSGSCLLLRQSAQEICNAFRLRPPSPKSA